MGNRILFIILFICFFQYSWAQKDTLELKALYDHALEVSEPDSLIYIADLLEKKSKELDYDKGELLSYRIRGIAAESLHDLDKAIEWYYKTLNIALDFGIPSYVSSAYTDLAIVYNSLHQYMKAREMFMKAADLNLKSGNLAAAVNSYGNLGAILNNMKQYDSAINILKKGIALAAGKKDLDITTLYNNLGNSYFFLKRYEEAAPLFKQNFDYCCKNKDREGEWVAGLNLSDIYTEKKMYDSAKWYLNYCDTLLALVPDVSRQADTYKMWAKFYERQGKYSEAFGFSQKWYALDSISINRHTNEVIAELESKFNLQEREQENTLLAAEVGRQKMITRFIFSIAFVFLIIAGLIAYLLYRDRRNAKKVQEQYNLISQQNERLNQLNHEKNSLIRMVSHDLGTPFAGIRMWTQVLQSQNLDDIQQKSISKIMSTARQGEDLIKRILEVEKDGIHERTINLEQFDLARFLEEIVADHHPRALQKDIEMKWREPSNPVWILSDKQMVKRVVDNLLSNAIKFTAPHKKVWLDLEESKQQIRIHIGDEGPGITPEEQKQLFTPYKQLSARPTAGESSTGLGLAIVKRLVSELNGKITVNSQPGSGSVFSIVLPS